MGCKSYIELKVAKGTQFRDLDQLSNKIAEGCEFDINDAGSNYRGFVLFDGKDFSFYQGAAGEDRDDTYSWQLRVYGDIFAQDFADHLVSGSFKFVYTPEGDPVEVYAASTPGVLETIIGPNDD